MTEEEIELIKSQIDKFTKSRIWELEDNPNLVKGNFDVQHLKSVHGFILQDSTQYIKAGEFREVVPDGYYHSKQRPAYPQGTEVFYSNKPSEATVDKILNQGMESLKNSKNIEDFSENMANIYAQLDYQHPFEEGNSRTLRYFSSLMAKETGYELDWSKTGENSLARIELYIARDSHILNTLYDFSPQHLAKLERTDNTEFGKHKEHLENDIQGFFRESSQTYNFRPLAQIIQDNTTKIEITQGKHFQYLNTPLKPENLQKDYPTLTTNQIEKISIYKDFLLEKYTTPEARSMALEHLNKQIPDIASGKIVLPDSPQEKTKGFSR